FQNKSNVSERSLTPPTKKMAIHREGNGETNSNGNSPTNTSPIRPPRPPKPRSMSTVSPEPQHSIATIDDSKSNYDLNISSEKIENLQDIKEVLNSPPSKKQDIKK